MPKKKLYFVGLLTNTDSSILNVKLDQGFKIKVVSDKEGYSLFSNLEALPYEEVSRKLFIDFPCLNPDEKKFYFVCNSYECTDESGTEILNAIREFDYNLVYSYLDPIIRLMRLFKEGNICMPLKYYYSIDNGIPKSFFRKGTHLYIPPKPKYTIKDSEISDLQEFILNIKLPFTNPSLQLAFENFELSYQTHNINLSFLSLMMGLETLFNPGEQELRYRISRNVAVLLGKDKKDSKTIFRDIKELYDKRSKIVHTGETNIIQEKDLLKLRQYLRESVKEINKIGKNKSELLSLLNLCGFGERPWRK